MADAKKDWNSGGAGGGGISKKEQKAAVAESLAAMIWRAAKSGTGKGSNETFQRLKSLRPAIVCTMAETQQVQRSKEFRNDGVTEFVVCTTCYKYEDLLETIKDELAMFMKKEGGGVVCLVYSCLLSRGLENVASDMDTNFGQVPKMIGSHSYANQELVNLFLTGCATSNLFNGETRFEDETGASADCVVMGGVGDVGDVGFVTLFEAYGTLEVGSNLKNPVAPVWVVCSESHYSVLFSTVAEHVVAKEGDNVLDVYYFDPLGEQEGEIKLGLKTDDDMPDGPGDETDLISPIDKVIRTKWNKVAVDWGKVDPIL